MMQYIPLDPDINKQDSPNLSMTDNKNILYLEFIMQYFKNKQYTFDCPSISISQLKLIENLFMHTTALDISLGMVFEV